jgi:hypothetical protein
VGVVKEISLNKTVYELCNNDPEFIEVMKDIGFVNITMPGMLQSAGRVMTIPKGCRARGVDLDDVVQKLESYGYRVTGHSQKGAEENE